MNNFFLIIILLIMCNSCSKQSVPLKYSDNLNIISVDGYIRDISIEGSKLYAVSESDGLLIYNLEENIDGDFISLSLSYADSLMYSTNGWELNHILYSDLLNSVFVLDKFYSIQYAPISDYYANNCLEKLTFDECNNPCSWDVGNNVCSPKVQYNSVCCNADSHHPSTFTFNSDDNEIFALVRHKSGQVGVPTDMVSIFKIGFIQIGNLIIVDTPEEVIDSLIYDVTDVFYGNDKLFVTHTDYNNNQFSVYEKNNSLFVLDSIITLPSKPESIYGTNNFIFIGMGSHGGLKIYDINSLEEKFWDAKGFSVKNIYFDSEKNKLLLSCGYQGVIIFELDNFMNVLNTWVLNTSYAYSAQIYNNYAFIGTRTGIEIIELD